MSQRKMAIIVAKGGLDEIYPGFILASGARQSDMSAMMFFTFYGLNAITEDKVDHLHVNLAGNAANPIPTMLAGLPGMEALAARMMGKKMAKLDIPGPREMLKTLDESGVDIYACKLAMEMFGLEKKDLIPQVRDVITVGDFYDLSDDARIIYT
ncbi:MAG: DsrE/DsrF/DrsH-like family protein [Myxococcales bacterium]|nr:DsrE/DsrF/DrsH-like family protein [Myxococcales bacterium]